MSFTPPASDGGSPITGYTVTSNPGQYRSHGAAKSHNCNRTDQRHFIHLYRDRPKRDRHRAGIRASNSVTPLSSPYSLNITFAGTGKGIVTGNGVYNGAPVSFSADTSITKQLDDRTSASLHAAPSEYSLFTNLDRGMQRHIRL